MICDTMCEFFSTCGARSSTVRYHQNVTRERHSERRESNSVRKEARHVTSGHHVTQDAHSVWGRVLRVDMAWLGPCAGASGCLHCYNFCLLDLVEYDA